MPLGHLFGLVLAAGQGGPGRIVASELGGWVSIAVWVIALVAVLWGGRSSLKTASGMVRAFVLLCFAILPASVVWLGNANQSYALRVWNKSGSAIHGVSVHMDERKTTFGALGSELFAKKAGQNTRPSAIAEVRWTDENGQSHEVRVDLSELVPRRYDNGVLTLTIHPNADVTGGFFINKRPEF